MSDKELAKREKADVTRRGQEPETYLPAADIWETENEIYVKLDMPGVEKDDIEINLENDTLQIYGKMSNSFKGRVLYSDQRTGDYHREFTLSQDLNRDTITADMKDGVLTVKVEKSEALKPRRIPVASAKEAQ
jgi:HSP20 family protein